LSNDNNPVGPPAYQAVAKILVLSCDLGLASCSMSFAPAIIVERVPPQLPAAAHYGAY
jgi:hypothetical protein